MDVLFEYGHYLQELDHYFPPPNPPLEMGIWVDGQLAGSISMSWLEDGPSAVEFGYARENVRSRAVAERLGYRYGMRPAE